MENLAKQQKEITISYNPFLFQTKFSINGKDQSYDKQLSKYSEEAFDLIVEDFIPELYQIVNENFIIKFRGRKAEYEDLNDVVNLFNNDHKKHVEVIHDAILDDEKSIDDMRTLFDEIQRGPFDDLKNKGITDAFHKATEKKDFEIGIIATMKAGKSTLLNSLLGIKLMPSKSEACTAKIFFVKDVDEKTSFTAKATSRNGELIYNESEATIGLLKTMNEDDKVSYIEIEGNIPGIRSDFKNLVIIDTPGPNNSRDNTHKDITEKFLRDENNGLVLYILNTKNISTNDNQVLMNYVSGLMSKKGKKSKERFIFVLNFVDDLDEDSDKDDSLKSVIENCKKDLESFGIINPNIFPASSYLALTSRLKLNNQDLTTHEKSHLNAKSEYFVDKLGYEVIENSPVRKTTKKMLLEEIEKAKISKNIIKQAELLSGIPAIEYYINSFMEKYSKPILIKDALNCFRKEVEEKNVLRNLITNIKNKHLEKEELLNKIHKIENEIKSGKKGADLIAKINDLKLSDEAEDILHSIRVEFEKNMKGIKDLFYNSELSLDEATHLTKDITKRLSSLLKNSQNKYDNFLNNHLYSDAKKLYKTYKEYADNLIGDNLKIDSNYNNLKKLLSIQIKTSDELITNVKPYDETITEYVNHERSNYNPLKLLMIFDEKWRYYSEEVVTIKKYVKVDDIKNIVQEMIEPYRINLGKLREQAVDELDRIRKNFLQEIDNLKKRILQRAEDLKILFNNQKSLDIVITEFENNKLWLDNINIKMDKFTEYI